MNRGLLMGLAAVMVVSGGLAAFSGYKLLNRSPVTNVRTQTVQGPPPGSDQEIIETFELTDRSGTTLGNEDLKGSVWVGSFFYASCPGSCRTQNMHLKALQQKFAKKGVKIVSITCDPKVDTPARLAAYADDFQANPDSWFFLTGDLLYIKRIGAEFFRVYVDERGHMDRFIAVDKWGNIRGYYNWHEPEKRKELEVMLETLLAETEPPADLSDPLGMTSATAVAGSEVEEDDEELADDEAAESEAAGEEVTVNVTDNGAEVVSDSEEDGASESVESASESPVESEVGAEL